MKTFLLFLCLVASTFAVPARSKPQSKHQISSKKLQETEGDPEQSMRNSEVLPTFITFEASSQEQEDEDVSYDGNGGEPREKSAPVLLSEEALADLLERSEEEPGQSEESQDEGGLEAVDGDEGGVEDVADVDGEEGGVEAVDGEEGGVDTDAPENNPSTEAEIPTEMDYSEDGDGLEEANDPGLPSKEEASDEVPEGGTDASLEEGKAGDSDSLEEGDQALLGEGNGLRGAPGESESRKHQGSRNGDALEAKNGVEPGVAPGGEAGAGAERNDSGSQAKARARKLRKNQRASLAGAERRKSQMEIVPDATDNTVQKSQKKKSGKWVPLVGMNPVQIRATEELYPHDAAHQDQGVQEVPVNPCEGFRCKRGKTCQVNQGKRPSCICQDPATCMPSLTEFDHVCGTDNKTYDTSCQLFATKCNLEGTKRGHRLHLDYTGDCKYIAPCLDSELDQFPLRMRDWLKNVLLQLYEHDTRSPGFLTPKQRLRVQKIHESERRLHAGDHPIEMLARDFEKNYNMYIYPVHWQFAQMDQHPSDRLLSHSELAPLRVPLVPMEHCTSRFFQECDADKDKQVSLEEWCHCFGIQDEDMDMSLLF